MFARKGGSLTVVEYSELDAAEASSCDPGARLAVSTPLAAITAACTCRVIHPGLAHLLHAL